MLRGEGGARKEALSGLPPLHAAKRSWRGGLGGEVGRGVRSLGQCAFRDVINAEALGDGCQTFHDRLDTPIEDRLSHPRIA